MEGESTGVRRRGQHSADDSAAEAKSGETVEATAKPKRNFSVPLEQAIALMEKDKFNEAAPILERAIEGLEKDDKDSAILHNLGVCYSEVGLFAEAEAVFWDAFELAPKDSDDVFRTMYGLASCLTAQDETVKNMQAEALLRDVLNKGMQRKGPGITEDMYRAYVLLGENLGRQKKWSDAAQCWEAAVQMGESMWEKDGTKHDLVEQHRMALARATRLGRWQGRLRIVTRTLVVVVPCAVAYYIYRTWPPAAFAHYWTQETAVEKQGVPHGL